MAAFDNYRSTTAENEERIGTENDADKRDVDKKKERIRVEDMTPEEVAAKQQEMWEQYFGPPSKIRVIYHNSTIMMYLIPSILILILMTVGLMVTILVFEGEL